MSRRHRRGTARDWLACALFVTVAGGCAKPAADTGDKTPEASVRVRVGTIASREFRPGLEATGQWHASGEIVVAAPFAAFVENLRVEVGDRVTRGELVAALVTHESRAAIVGARQLIAASATPEARAEAERALAAAERDLVRVPVRATGAGVVARRSASAGAEIAEGAELLAIVPDGGLVFEAHVPLRDAGAVTVGRGARIRAEDGSVVAGRVQRRLPQTSEIDQTALVWIAPERSAPSSYRDRFATAVIDTGRVRRGMAVPDSALVEDDLTGVTRVARLDASGVAIWTTVHVGAASEGWHELLDPALPAGTRVLIEGQRGLPDSTQVEVAP